MKSQTILNHYTLDSFCEFLIEKGNLFLLTSERVNEFKNLPRIDLIIIDEFYKLSAKRDDERADSLNNAFNYVLKTFNSKFYLLTSCKEFH